MESLVLNLYGLWFWLTRKARTMHYCEAASILNSALNHLRSDFGSRASTRDRGSLLPHQLEALSILERHIAYVTAASNRFHSLSECCKFVAEELVGPPAQVEMAETPAILDTVPLEPVSFAAAPASSVPQIARAA